MDACPFLSRNPDGEPAPDGGTTSLAPRDARAGGVFGAAKFKTGAQSHRNRHLSHDWRGGDGGGWAWWWWRLLLCPPLWQAQRPSVDLMAMGGAVSGLRPGPLPGVEQRAFRESETRAQRTGLPGAHLPLSSQGPFWCPPGPPSLWWRVGTPCLGGHSDMPCPEMTSARSLRRAGRWPGVGTHVGSHPVPPGRKLPSPGAGMPRASHLPSKTRPHSGWEGPRPGASCARSQVPGPLLCVAGSPGVERAANTGPVWPWGWPHPVGTSPSSWGQRALKGHVPLGAWKAGWEEVRPATAAGPPCVPSLLTQSPIHPVHPPQ